MNRQIAKIYRDIREVRIQGASNVAKAAIRAYMMHPSRENKKILIGLRPTEPMLVNALNNLDNMPINLILEHFEEAQEKINKNVYKIINNGSVIFTHCHSTNVVKAL